MKLFFLRCLFIFTAALVFLWGLSKCSPLMPKQPSSINSSEFHFEYFPKTLDSLNHIVLQGSSWQMGKGQAIALTPLLYKQEEHLMQFLSPVLSRFYIREPLLVFLKLWYWGIADFLEPWMTDEMAAVGVGTSTKYDGLADRTTRQLAYHGIHELGQLFVDFNKSDRGCTVFAVAGKKGGWWMGRALDFEGGRIFDDEKVIQWRFPDGANAYVSVIWAGMVGSVTAINEWGVYGSINAAGTKDFSRLGTPTSLVLSKVMRETKNADEAANLICKAQVFVSDIFVIADKLSAYRIEKSPKHCEIIKLNSNSVVTNHMLSSRWASDSFNVYRRDKLTSNKKQVRGEQLLVSAHEQVSTLKTAEMMISMLRDKKELSLGHRTSIDALIATHGVVYSSQNNLLWISEGPSLSGRFLAFDLARSFREKKPVSAKLNVGPDPEISKQVYEQIHAGRKKVSALLKKIDDKDACVANKFALQQIADEFKPSTEFLLASAKWEFLCGSKQKSIEFLTRAKQGAPAYEDESEEIEKLLRR